MSSPVVLLSRSCLRLRPHQPPFASQPTRTPWNVMHPDPRIHRHTALSHLGTLRTARSGGLSLHRIGVADGAISRIVSHLVHSILARPSSYRRPPVFSNRAVPYSVSVSFLGSSLSLSLSLFLCVLVSSHHVCTFITPTYSYLLFIPYSFSFLSVYKPLFFSWSSLTLITLTNP